jgi:hypothetical protein
MAFRNYWTIKDGKIIKGQEEFKWEPGMSTSQRRKSCKNLHEVIKEKTGSLPLDISSASTTELGVKLSAFNLIWRGHSIECWYQGSKVYSIAGPMHHLYNMTSRQAKASMKEANLGKLIGFNLEGVDYPMEPKTVFYDYLYLMGLIENYGQDLDLSEYEYFTDVQAVINIDACQARTVCEYKLLKEQGLLDKIKDFSNFDDFVKWHKMFVAG